MPTQNLTQKWKRILPRAALIIFLLALLPFVLTEAARTFEVREYSDRALLDAINYGWVSNVEELIRLRAYPKEIRHGRNQLFWATLNSKNRNWESRLKIIHVLIEADVDVTVPNKNGRFPIIELLRQLPPEDDHNEDAQAIVRHLLTHGVGPNAIDTKGWTVLTIAAKQELHEVSKILIESGAAVGPLECIALGDFDALRKHIDEHPAVTTSLNHPVSLLMFSVQFDSAEIVRLLLESRAPPNLRDKYGYTALHYAVSALSHTDTMDRLQVACPGSISLLLEYGAGPNIKTTGWPRERDKYARTRDVRIQFFREQTPLHLACSEADIETIRELVDAGAAVNAKDSGWRRPLHYAALRRSLDRKEVIDLLLDAGASPTHRDFNNLSALIFAAKNNDEVTLPIVKLLIEHGAKADDVGALGETALHNVMLPSVAKLLIDLGADVNAQDINLRTPLHLIFGNYPEKNSVENLSKLITVLIDNGADVSATDSMGMTPGDWAFGDREWRDFTDRLPVRKHRVRAIQLGLDVSPSPPNESAQGVHRGDID